MDPWSTDRFSFMYKGMDAAGSAANTGTHRILRISSSTVSEKISIFGLWLWIEPLLIEALLWQEHLSHSLLNSSQPGPHPFSEAPEQLSVRERSSHFEPRKMSHQRDHVPVLGKDGWCLALLVCD